MRADLLAGIRHPPVPVRSGHATILVLDSGVGGLTVLREIARARPDAALVYAADDAAFPYGDWAEEPLIARVGDVVGHLVGRVRPDLVVIACNTISTLVMPALRARFPLPFVGTVPAIKPAAELSRSGRVGVLATPGTVARDYTRGLVEAFAGGCTVDLVGSTRLAGMAEAELAGEPVPDDEIAREIAPCFRDVDGRRTDVVVLACTHYPLLMERMRRLAPWPVRWIDPAPAVARRVESILETPSADAAPAPHRAIFTGTGPASSRMREALAGFGLADIETGACPLGSSH